MSSSPKIYLAGGMEKAGEYGAIWRRDITPRLNELGYEVWNPYLEEMNVGVNVEKLATLKQTDYDQFLEHCRRIVDYDIAHLVRCAAVAVRIDDSVLKGAGTYGELTVCKLYKVPVYAWIDLPNGKMDVPSWAMGCLTHYTTDKDEFYAMIPPAKERPHDHNLDEYVKEWEEEMCDY
jgi:hypothetical protein